MNLVDSKLVLPLVESLEDRVKELESVIDTMGTVVNELNMRTMYLMDKIRLKRASNILDANNQPQILERPMAYFWMEDRAAFMKQVEHAQAQAEAAAQAAAQAAVANQPRSSNGRALGLGPRSRS